MMHFAHVLSRETYQSYWMDHTTVPDEDLSGLHLRKNTKHLMTVDSNECCVYVNSLETFASTGLRELIEPAASDRGVTKQHDVYLWHDADVTSFGVLARFFNWIIRIENGLSACTKFYWKRRYLFPQDTIIWNEFIFPEVVSFCWNSILLFKRNISRKCSDSDNLKLSSIRCCFLIYRNTFRVNGVYWRNYHYFVVIHEPLADKLSLVRVNRGRMQRYSSIRSANITNI